MTWLSYGTMRITTSSLLATPQVSALTAYSYHDLRFYNYSIATTQLSGIDASDCSKRFGRLQDNLLLHNRNVKRQSR